METVFALSGRQYGELRRHLYPGDNHEGVALVFCGRARQTDGTRLTAMRVVPVPHDAVTVREPDAIQWSVEDHVLPLVEEMERDDLALVVVHCHPGGYPKFSVTDDEADRLLFPSVHSWFDASGEHGAAVMLPDGAMFGRAVDSEGRFTPFRRISVSGDDLLFFPKPTTVSNVPAAAKRVSQTFGSGTYALLRSLRIGVVGCSGTGSIVAELLARNCVGALVLIDDDVVEEKNLNRILNSRAVDADHRIPKVDMLAAAIRAYGLGTVVEPLKASLLDAEGFQRATTCDVVFGCMDTAEGRHLLGQICTAYLIPFFDVGVHIELDGNGSISHAVAAAHYIQPGGSSLLSRGIYTGEDLDAESAQRTAPEDYDRRVASGYLKAIEEDRPAVMPINMMAANLGFLDFLARLQGYRLDPNAQFARQTISLTHGYHEQMDDGAPCKVMRQIVGLGDRLLKP